MTKYATGSLRKFERKMRDFGSGFSARPIYTEIVRATEARDSAGPFEAIPTYNVPTSMIFSFGSESNEMDQICAT